MNTGIRARKSLYERLAQGNGACAPPNDKPLMKTLKLILGVAVLCGLMTTHLRAQSSTVSKIDLDRKISKIDPNIYGAPVKGFAPLSLRLVAER